MSLLTDLCRCYGRSHIITVWPTGTRGETALICTSRSPQIYYVRYAVFAPLRLICNQGGTFLEPLMKFLELMNPDASIFATVIVAHAYMGCIF